MSEQGKDKRMDASPVIHDSRDDTAAKDSKLRRQKLAQIASHARMDNGAGLNRYIEQLNRDEERAARSEKINNRWRRYQVVKEIVWIAMVCAEVGIFYLMLQLYKDWS